MPAHGSFEAFLPMPWRGERPPLSRSVRVMTWWGSLVAPGVPAARPEEVADQRACHQAPHPDVRVADGPERVSPTRKSRSGVSLLQKVHRRHRCDLMVSHVVSLHDRGCGASRRFLGAAVVFRASEPCAA